MMQTLQSITRGKEFKNYLQTASISAYMVDIASLNCVISDAVLLESLSVSKNEAAC